MQKFWMVYNPKNSNKWPQHKHSSKNEAITEAKRRAKQDWKDSFIVLEAVEEYHVPIQEPVRVTLVEQTQVHVGNLAG